MSFFFLCGPLNIVHIALHSTCTLKIDSLAREKYISSIVVCTLFNRGDGGGDLRSSLHLVHGTAQRYILNNKFSCSVHFFELAHRQRLSSPCSIHWGGGGNREGGNQLY